MNPAQRARRLLPLLLAIAALPLALTLEGCGGSGSSRPPRRAPPAATRGCTECHQPFVESLAGRAPHFADLGTRCEDCHDRHGLVGVLKLKQDEPELCLECHADTRGELAQGHPHGPLAEGRCSDCHDPHAATPAGGALLLATGRDLCLTCHDRAGFEGPSGARTGGRRLLGLPRRARERHARGPQGTRARPVPRLPPGRAAGLRGRAPGP